MKTPAKQVEKEPTLPELIQSVSKSVRNLESLKLNHKAIVVLLHDYTKLNKRDIESVLDGLSSLERTYCR